MPLGRGKHRLGVLGCTPLGVLVVCGVLGVRWGVKGWFGGEFALGWLLWGGGVFFRG